MNRFKDPFLPSIVMNGAELPENKHFRLLGLTFSNDLTWNNYIESIAKSAAMKIGSLYRARNFLSPESILYLYKATIRPCLEYCYLVLLLIVLVCLTAYRGELLTLLDLIFAQIYSPYLIAVMLHHCLYFINTSMVVVLTNWSLWPLLLNLLNVWLDFQLVHILLLYSCLLVINTSIQQVSFLTLLTCGILYHPLTFHHLMTFKSSSVMFIIIYHLVNPPSFLALYLLVALCLVESDLFKKKNWPMIPYIILNRISRSCRWRYSFVKIPKKNFNPMEDIALYLVVFCTWLVM